MKDWKRELIEDVLRDYHSHCEYLRRVKKKARKVLQLELRIIEALQHPVNMVYGEQKVYIWADNVHAAHDIAKAFGVQFSKKVDSDGLAYVGSINGIEILIYGIKQHPSCRLVEKKVTETVTKTVYEVVCD